VLDDALGLEAGDLIGGLADNLDIVSELGDLLGGAFDIADPTPPLRHLLDGVQETTSGLDSILGALGGRLAD
jgi:hypothetical protein